MSNKNCQPQPDLKLWVRLDVMITKENFLSTPNWYTRWIVLYPAQKHNQSEINFVTDSDFGDLFFGKGYFL